MIHLCTPDPCLWVRQCDDYLRSGGIKPVAAFDTAGSAEHVKEHALRDTAAIASVHAAEVHGLQVLDAGIEDDSNNFTRFLILGRKPPIPPAAGVAKTSVLFVLSSKDAPGSLFKALSVFAVRDINLSKIESRPHRHVRSLTAGTPSPKRQRADSGPHFEYTFYADIHASAVEERTRNALRHLEEMCAVVRVLGCFPLDGVQFESANPVTAIAPVTRAVTGTRLRIAIVGFGTFGQFLARRWAAGGHAVAGHSRKDYSHAAASMGVTFAHTAAELHTWMPDVILLSVSIISFEKVLAALPAELLATALVVDVLSVKVHRHDSRRCGVW